MLAVAIGFRIGHEFILRKRYVSGAITLCKKLFEISIKGKEAFDFGVKLATTMKSSPYAATAADHKVLWLHDHNVWQIYQLVVPMVETKKINEENSLQVNLDQRI